MKNVGSRQRDLDNVKQRARQHGLNYYAATELTVLS